MLPFGDGSSGSIGIVFALFVVVAIAVGIGGMILQGRRRDALHQWATSRGFSFHAGDADDVLSRLQTLSLFNRGRGHRAYHTITGQLNAFQRFVSFAMGDFSYVETQGTGKDSRDVTHRFSYALVMLPFDTPSVTLRKETILDRFAGALGFDDIDFESVEFSERFHVKASDPRFAYDLIHPRVMEHLLSASYPEFVLDSGLLVITNGSRIWPVEAWEVVLRELQGLLTRWPEHLLPPGGP